jgi:uncharacterized RDD family membrane protein YckC
MRPTIDQITQNKTFYKRDRDAFGNRTKEPYQKAVLRKVQLVTGWLRFGHYIIDAIIIGLILFGLNIVVFHGVYLGVSPSLEINGIVYHLIPSLDTIVVTVAYYFICEQTMQRTIGKFATNSVVINQFAEAPNYGSLIGRSFSRLVPFEALSCFSDRGWHDRWSTTYVVTTHERDTLKKLLNAQQGIFISDSPDLLD